MANLRVDKITSTETFETTGSVQFDGTGDYLDVSDSSDWDFGLGPFTIECWVLMHPSSVDYSGIFGMHTGSTQFQFRINNQGRIQFLQDFGGTRGNIADSDATGVNLRDSTWHHVAMVRQSDYSWQLYVDGKVNYSGTYMSGNVTGINEVAIGRRTDANDYYLNGFISNMRVLNRAIYTENFKPPMRELEVIPGTVLLACQSKTDATLEKTGKTITANGNAVASELTPGILTPVPKAGAGSAITGSVEFDGTGDYLTLANSSDFNFGTGDFTVECFIHVNKHLAGATDVIVSTYQDSSNGWTMGIHATTDKFYFAIAGDSAQLDDPGNLLTESWVHLAASRSGSTAKFFINGVEAASASNSTNQTSTSDLHIGTNVGGGALSTEGFISNLRVVKGTALYTDNFIPPTRELKKVPGTVLLCCQDEDSETTEATGKTITSYGDPAASNFTPQVGDDRKVTFEGVTKINSAAYFYLPTGDTASREATGTYNAGTRGLFAGGYDQPALADTIDYITISSTGNALDFGNLTDARLLPGALASSVRGIIGGGTDPSASNIIDYVTILSTGNANDFGDLTVKRRAMASFSNDVRGIWAGGDNPSRQTTIDYVTISSRGDAVAFGSLGEATNTLHGTSSPTRGLLMGGETGSVSPHNAISYVTISTTGSNNDFGDLTQARRGCSSCSSPIRALTGGGNTGSVTNIIDFVTIATTGNAFDFGDLTQARWLVAATSNSIRGVWGGGYNPSPAAEKERIDFITISSTGNAIDFGNLQTSKRSVGACSNGHGGLG